MTAQKSEFETYQQQVNKRSRFRGLFVMALVVGLVTLAGLWSWSGHVKESYKQAQLSKWSPPWDVSSVMKQYDASPYAGGLVRIPDVVVIEVNPDPLVICPNSPGTSTGVSARTSNDEELVIPLVAIVKVKERETYLNASRLAGLGKPLPLAEFMEIMGNNLLVKEIRSAATEHSSEVIVSKQSTFLRKITTPCGEQLEKNGVELVALEYVPNVPWSQTSSI